MQCRHVFWELLLVYVLCYHRSKNFGHLFVANCSGFVIILRIVLPHYCAKHFGHLFVTNRCSGIVILRIVPPHDYSSANFGYLFVTNRFSYRACIVCHLFVANRCSCRACYYIRVLVTCLSPTDVHAGLVIILGFWSPVCRQQMFMQGLLLYWGFGHLFVANRCSCRACYYN